MRVLAMLLSGLLLGARATNRSYYRYGLPGVVSLSDPVLLVITLRNRSDEPRYVHRNVQRHWISRSSARTEIMSRKFLHPFKMPLEVTDNRDWVRVEASRRCGARSRCDQPNSASKRPVFSVRGFWRQTP